MNVSLTEELQNFVKMQVQSGHYTSASEVIRDALRDKIQSLTQQQFQQRLQESRDEYLLGKYSVADDDFFDQKEAYIQEKFNLNK